MKILNMCKKSIQKSIFSFYVFPRISAKQIEVEFDLPSENKAEDGTLNVIALYR
jgi:hypothetical protein